MTTGFPVYDAHGNNVATLSRSGSGGFSLADRRTYDAWGVVRSQQSGGDPKLRYCASLGHRQDDESGLVYMRARYYEPTSGRFVSQDPGHHNANWFIYGKDDPVNNVDKSGCSDESERQAWIGTIIMALGITLMGGSIFMFCSNLPPAAGELKDFLNRAEQVLHFELNDEAAENAMMREFEESLQNGKLASTGRCLGSAATAIAGYGLMLYGAMLWTDSDSIDPSSPNEGLYGLFK